VGAAEIIGYLGGARGSLGLLPTQRDVVFERFFDETGGMQLVIHAPLGGRINRALGLALRKRFCRRFDFELQAAASDDAVVLSLSPGQSLPLEEMPRFLTSRTAAETLAQALLLSPMFQVRWRWNLGRALIVLRQRGGRRNPPPIQRMEADDLMAAVFPALAGCQENAAAGPVEIPDHPMVRQTMHDCLHEATDVDGLVGLLEAIEAGRVRPHFVDSSEPSPLSHEILNGRPYTFLDDAPLEERRTRAVALRRGLPESARELGHLDPAAIARVRDEARPEPRDAEELHDALLGLVLARPRDEWAPWFDELVRQGRAARAATAAGVFWMATEQRGAIEALFPGAAIDPDVRLPATRGRAAAAMDQERAAVEAARGHLATMGPATAMDLAGRTGLGPAVAAQALARLELEGFALRGRFDPDRSGDPGAVEFCERRLLARIHRYTTERLRREIEPVTAQDFMRFLLRWQHVAPDAQMEGRRGVLAVVEQLQGFEVAAGSWEETVLPSRIAAYRPEWLDDLCLSGEVIWGRLAARAPEAAPADEPTGRGGAVPSRATPVTFAVRDNFAWLLRAVRGPAEPVPPGDGAARAVLDALRTRGALFYNDLVAATGRLRVEVEEGLWDLVSRGLVTADGFGSVRALLTSRERWAKRAARLPRGRRLRRSGREVVVGAEGRWSLLLPPAPPDAADGESLAEAVAEQLLARWGVVFRDLALRESLAIPWREVLWALRRMEARGTARGGRFVTGFVGEQYALPEAVEALRRTRRTERCGETVRIAAVDPLNLTGIITPGPRVPAVRGHVVIYRDGLPLAPSTPLAPALTLGR
jgi:ATP-dependent Lhr-like helicase